METPTRCACGRALHYASPESRRIVEMLIDALGPNVRVTTPWGAWYVPRHYIALHGLASKSVPDLAKQYGWDKATWPAA